MRTALLKLSVALVAVVTMPTLVRVCFGQAASPAYVGACDNIEKLSSPRWCIETWYDEQGVFHQETCRDSHWLARYRDGKSNPNDWEEYDCDPPEEPTCHADPDKPPATPPWQDMWVYSACTLAPGQVPMSRTSTWKKDSEEFMKTYELALTSPSAPSMAPYVLGAKRDRIYYARCSGGAYLPKWVKA